MQFDIEEFYPLISKELLLKAINPFNTIATLVPTIILPNYRRTSSLIATIFYGYDLGVIA